MELGLHRTDSGVGMQGRWPLHKFVQETWRGGSASLWSNWWSNFLTRNILVRKYLFSLPSHTFFKKISNIMIFLCTWILWSQLWKQVGREYKVLSKRTCVSVYLRACVCVTVGAQSQQHAYACGRSKSQESSRPAFKLVVLKISFSLYLTGCEH